MDNTLESANLRKWLSQPPKYTTFRINTLKNFCLATMKNFLIEQSKELGLPDIPEVYLLRDDCLVLEQWHIPPMEPTGDEVIVDAICAAAVLRGAHIFAPGVMGLSPHCKPYQLVDIYGDLEGKCKRGLKIKYEGKKLHVGSGYLKLTRKDLFDETSVLSGIAVHTLLPISRLPVVNESLYPKGEILLQNLPSTVCGWVVNAHPHEFILDMCAAPGNKTTHLAEMSHNQANIVALDKSQQKVDKIRESCDVQGVTCVKAYVYDSRKCCDDDCTTNTGTGEPPFNPNTFDKVLLDGPCSGLGLRPQLVDTKMSPKMLQSYKFVQRKLFDAAVRVLKVGGTLVYSTCTTTVEENEGMVTWALNKFPCLELIPAEPLVGGPGLRNCGLTDSQRAMVQRFGPENDPLRPVDNIYRDTIGFFIAKFKKTVKCK